ncbi:dCTP deaminase [Candidatus Micrarchaeota archaeon]|nr:dCTP deaminase [Candidatus Micrarchaeota archaeon]
MILSDKTILERIQAKDLVVDPFKKECVQPSSIDLHLSHEFRVFKFTNHSVIDLKDEVKDYTELVSVKDKPFIIHPGEFTLGSTVERVKIPLDLVARLEGKSSLGRLGIIVHATAGYIDPGFEGHITLELNNVGKIPVALYPNMRIAQISFQTMSTPPLRPYGQAGNRYQGQTGPTESRIAKDAID